MHILTRREALSTEKHFCNKENYYTSKTFFSGVKENTRKLMHVLNWNKRETVQSPRKILSCNPCSDTRDNRFFILHNAFAADGKIHALDEIQRKSNNNHKAQISALTDEIILCRLGTFELHH